MEFGFGGMMKRDSLKVLTGAAAALSYTHAAYAVAVSKQIISEPIFLGRTWGVGVMWTEAAVYGAAAAGLAYLAWRPQPEETSTATTSIDRA